MYKRVNTIVAALVVAAVLSLAGVAYAADGAAPGDALYGFDCALAELGIGDGGMQERLVEAGQLMDKGQVDEGLALVADALDEEQKDLDEDGDGEVSEGEESAGREALSAAAEAVLSQGSEQSLEVREGVAEKLSTMATTDLTGKEFGQAVSELARGVTSVGSDDGSSSDDNVPSSNADKEKSNNGKANDDSE